MIWFELYKRNELNGMLLESYDEVYDEKPSQQRQTYTLLRRRWLYYDWVKKNEFNWDGIWVSKMRNMYHINQETSKSKTRNTLSYQTDTNLRAVRKGMVWVVYRGNMKLNWNDIVSVVWWETCIITNRDKLTPCWADDDWLWCDKRRNEYQVRWC